MSLLAVRTDFEPANATEGASALYYDPQTGATYAAMAATFALRIASLKGRFAPNNQKLAIWGCGWGWLVNLAVTAGYDAYGFDASTYAITKGKAQFPAIASRLFLRDALVSADMTASKGDAGIHGQSKFALLVSEDLLECMSDAEITTTLPLLRGSCSANLGHILTFKDPDPNVYQDARVNWKLASVWKSLLAPDAAIGPNGEAV